MRQIVLDTETTGLHVEDGNRILEIGAVELIGRRLTGNNYHQYIQPQRESEAEALQVHGITSEFLADKPLFSEIAPEFFEYIKGAELVIHNAPFDVGFMDVEFALLNEGYPKIHDVCKVLDTLSLARELYPGARHSLDALCRRHGIDNSHRQLHGALLDAEILADVYLAMTSGQTNLSLGGDADGFGEAGASLRRVNADRAPLAIIRATEEELAIHEERLDFIAKKSGGSVVWRG